MKYPQLEYLIENVDKEISLRGTLSDTPWQHLIGNPKGYPYYEYFDLTDGYQIVIYSKDEITSRKDLLIHGKVAKIEGKGKRSSDSFTEYHMIVDNWEKID